MITITDRFITSFDRALKTLVPKSNQASQKSPARDYIDAELSDSEKRHAAGLMRINHTGEVCAQALYQGQALTAKLTEVRDTMDQAADEEIDHLVWCEDRLSQLDAKPSLLNPLFYGLSFTIGALAGKAGDKYSLGFVAATEQQVCKHLKKHLNELPEQDQKSKAILTQMLEDEEKHAQSALDSGGIDFPESVQKIMTSMSEVMTKSTYRI